MFPFISFFFGFVSLIVFPLYETVVGILYFHIWCAFNVKPFSKVLRESEKYAVVVYIPLNRPNTHRTKSSSPSPSSASWDAVIKKIWREPKSSANALWNILCIKSSNIFFCLFVACAFCLLPSLSLFHVSLHVYKCMFILYEDCAVCVQCASTMYTWYGWCTCAYEHITLTLKHSFN